MKDTNYDKKQCFSGEDSLQGSNYPDVDVRVLQPQTQSSPDVNRKDTKMKLEIEINKDGLSTSELQELLDFLEDLDTGDIKNVLELGTLKSTRKDMVISLGRTQ